MILLIVIWVSWIYALLTFINFGNFQPCLMERHVFNLHFFSGTPIHLYYGCKPTLATSCEELTHWKRLWCWEGLGAGGEGDDRGWDDWMASLTRWTWVWVNSGRWWWTGRPGVLWFMGLQRVGHDWATDLIWSDLISLQFVCSVVIPCSPVLFFSLLFLTSSLPSSLLFLFCSFLSLLFVSTSVIYNKVQIQWCFKLCPIFR